MRKSSTKSAAALAAIRQIDFSQMLYRGFWVKRNALNGHLWIEKDGFHIGSLDPHESWDAARRIIDDILS